jgi:hypothetical protein
VVSDHAQSFAEVDNGSRLPPLNARRLGVVSRVRGPGS